MGRYTELQLSSELLDQPAFAGSPKKLFICSTPRSGSYLLCRYMINAGLGVPHEYFNPYVIRQMAPRLGFEDELKTIRWLPAGFMDRFNLRAKERQAELAFLRKYISVLFSRRCQGGVFAAKIHFRDFRTILDNAVGRELLSEGVFIFLYRENLLAQAISERFGRLTGRWGIDDTVTTPPAANPDFFNLKAIDGTIDYLSQQERGWRVFLARQGATPLSISYERLREDPFAFVVAIARSLGVNPEILTNTYSEPVSSVEEKSDMPSKDAVLKSYLASIS